MTLSRLTAIQKQNDMIAELPVCCVFKHGFKSFPLESMTQLDCIWGGGMGKRNGRLLKRNLEI